MENFGICLLSVVPVRKSPYDSSEMTTQLLFGDLVQISHQHHQWYNIRQEYDNYEGWIDKKQLVPISEKTYRTLANLPTSVSLDLVNSLTNNTSNFPQLILFGSSFPGMIKSTFYISDMIYAFEGETYQPGEENKREDIIDNAYVFKGAPYLWGGKTPFGVDCSGFTQIVYKASGIRLLRDTKEQITQGETINILQEARPGDLAFFDNEKGEISHVGILLADNNIIHASGKVHIDGIDHEGIYNREEKKYTHKLRLVKTLF